MDIVRKSAWISQHAPSRRHRAADSPQVGEPGIVAEVELLTAVATFFKRLGVGPDIVGIRVNSKSVRCGHHEGRRAAGQVRARLCGRR